MPKFLCVHCATKLSALIFYFQLHCTNQMYVDVVWMFNFTYLDKKTELNNWKDLACLRPLSPIMMSQLEWYMVNLFLTPTVMKTHVVCVHLMPLMRGMHVLSLEPADTIELNPFQICNENITNWRNNSHMRNIPIQRIALNMMSHNHLYSHQSALSNMHSLFQHFLPSTTIYKDKSDTKNSVHHFSS